MSIVVAGMGGSRFTPKTIKELFRDHIRLPYEIIEDYTLPAYVHHDTIVVLSSYSGSTEEIVSCGQDAVKRGALLTGIIGSNSPLAAFLAQHQAPMYAFTPIHNPCNQPRIGAGYLLMGHAGLLRALGALTLTDEEVSQAIQFARSVSARCAPTVETKENPAKQLAISLYNRYPLVVTAEFLRGAGNAFANQLNETAKMMSDYRYIPELNHHLMEGLSSPKEFATWGLFLFIRSPLYSARVNRRFDITGDIVKQQGFQSHSVTLIGQTKLEATLECFVLSGFTTYYLAVLADRDPVTVPWVDLFKRKLQQKEAA